MLAGSIVGGLLALALLVALASAAVSAMNGEANGAHSAPYMPTVTSAAAASATYGASVDATSTVMANYVTPTPPFVAVTGARLGGPLSAFDAVFGPEQNTGVWYTTLSGQSTMLSVQADATTGGSNPIATTDGSNRVWTLSVMYTGPNVPTTSQNAAICHQFLPPDAQHVTDNPNAPNPTEHIYHSKELAASFEANSFQNSAGAEAPPSAFDVIYDTRACMN